MSALVREALSEIATRFVLLPTIVADALDTHGPEAIAWAWFDGARLIRLDVDSSGRGSGSSDSSSTDPVKEP